MSAVSQTCIVSNEICNYRVLQIKNYWKKKNNNFLYTVRICTIWYSWIDQVIFGLPWCSEHRTQQAFPMELWGHSEGTLTKK